MVKFDGYDVSGSCCVPVFLACHKFDMSGNVPEHNSLYSLHMPSLSIKARD